MRRIRVSASMATIALLAITGVAMATPMPNSAVIFARVFNDCPGSTLVTNNMYPSLISIGDTNAGCVGFANLHVWRFSEDGVNPAEYHNHDKFRMCADLV